MALAAERSFVMAVKEAKDIIAGPEPSVGPVGSVGTVPVVSHGKMAGFQQQKSGFHGLYHEKGIEKMGLDRLMSMESK